MANYNYYESELKRLNVKSKFRPTIQLTDVDGNKTKCMDINDESAQVLIAWLKNNFITNK